MKNKKSCTDGGSVQLYVFVRIAYAFEIAVEGFVGDDYCACAIVGMEREGWSIAKSLIEKEMDMMVGIVDESEGRYAAWLQAQVLLHTLG